MGGASFLKDDWRYLNYIIISPTLWTCAKHSLLAVTKEFTSLVSEPLRGKWRSKDCEAIWELELWTASPASPNLRVRTGMMGSLTSPPRLWAHLTENPLQVPASRARWEHGLLIFAWQRKRGSSGEPENLQGVARVGEGPLWPPANPCPESWFLSSRPFQVSLEQDRVQSQNLHGDSQLYILPHRVVDRSWQLVPLFFLSPFRSWTSSVDVTVWKGWM